VEKSAVDFFGGKKRNPRRCVFLGVADKKENGRGAEKK